MIVITGDTYPVREKLKALGCRWNAALQCWMAPEGKAEEARAIVSQCGHAQSRCGTFRPRTCEHCCCPINYGRFCGKCEFQR